MGKEVKVGKDNFEKEVRQAALPVLVDFWAPWCMPCKMMEPILGELAIDYAGRLKVAKVNIDEEMELAHQFGIESVPTMLVFKNGEIVDRRVGAAPRHILDSFLKNHL